MQNVSKAYKQSMKANVATMDRNRGYIRATIGIINQEAQDNVEADYTNVFTYFANWRNPFEGYSVDRIYATGEKDFSHVDNSMYFLPKQSSQMDYYNNGLVTDALYGQIKISFGEETGLDIKGLTIDFGEYYPTDFTIENDLGVHTYNNNDKQYFVTEDVFNSTSFLIIKPSKMVNTEGRLRIYSFQCGIVNVFTNKEVRNYTQKEVCSSITDKIPSVDMTLEVDNQDLYYCPDNPDSALAYMEVGQEIKVAFGYDVEGDGKIEWLEPKTAFLKKWQADDIKAKFTATDRFDNSLGENYKRGLYRENGISLYDLAMDVLQDADITDERDYFIDPYLKKIKVKNPMPVVKHGEALQIIANAGRCTMQEDRNNRIWIKSMFIPDMTPSTNDMMHYGHIDTILKDDAKEDYAEASNRFTSVDNTLFFMPKDMSFLNTGYVSKSIYRRLSEEGSISPHLAYRLGNKDVDTLMTEDESGYWDDKIPAITIMLEASFTCYGLKINFRNNAPKQFTIYTYNQDILQDTFVITDPDTEWVTYEQFYDFDKMIIVFDKGSPNSRLFIDNIIVGDVTDYLIGRNDVYNSPTATRYTKVKTLSVNKKTYSPSTEEMKDLKSEEITLSEDTEILVDLSKASYGLQAIIAEETDENNNPIVNNDVTVTIKESSSFYALLSFKVTKETTFTYKVQGWEYSVTDTLYDHNYNEKGDVITWTNPLISDEEHAKDVEQWLSEYYLGDVDYQIKWRGDPRTDANDLFYLELKDRPTTLIRAYQNELKFNGAWSGTLKARKAILYGNAGNSNTT